MVSLVFVNGTDRPRITPERSLSAGWSGLSCPTCMAVGNFKLLEVGRPTHWERHYFVGFQSLTVDKWKSGGAEDKHVWPPSLSTLQGGCDQML